MQSSWYRWYALGILVLVYCSSHVDRQIMGILLEPIKRTKKKVQCLRVYGKAVQTVKRLFTVLILNQICMSA